MIKIKNYNNTTTWLLYLRNHNPNINARTAILVDYHSDKILYEFDETLRFILHQ